MANHGPSAAGNVTAVVALPPVVTEFLCSACTQHGNVLTWTQPSLASGGSISNTVTFTAVRPGAGLILRAAGSRNPDPHLLNNIALAIITVKH